MDLLAFVSDAGGIDYIETSFHWRLWRMAQQEEGRYLYNTKKRTGDTGVIMSLLLPDVF